QIRALGLTDVVTLHGRIPFEAIPAAIAAADIGLAPTHLDSYTRYSLSTKIFEYGAMARPAIATRLPLVERTFGADAVAVYEPGDADDLATVILRLVDDPSERERRVAATSALVADLAWERTSRRYLDLVERLAPDGLSSPDPLADPTPRAAEHQEDS
ncbi:MAG: hypothetical protein QOF49_306, partial [Chloroflexota bacterium]|nr:hypothetical protein [Chloroflexota bacterium]